MAPNISSTNLKILTEKDIQNSLATMKMLDDKNDTQNSEACIQTDWSKNELKWNNIILIGAFHLYFIYACFTFKFFENLKTTAWREYCLKKFFLYLVILSGIC